MNIPSDGTMNIPFQTAKQIQNMRNLSSLQLKLDLNHLEDWLKVLYLGSMDLLFTYPRSV